ncbi:MAG: ubiquinone/menaquinone biosynthesis methyltransferase, partial [Tepidiformaceae bacterium]
MTAVLPPPEEKAAAVQRMFDRIAPSYDRVNRVMTFGMDQRWRRKLLAQLDVRDGDVVLDLATGTGDFARMVREVTDRVVALDFSRGMLVAAQKRPLRGAELVQGDGLRLPLATASIDVAVSGFALRNFSSIPPVLAELARVLRPGGRVGLLEVDRPRSRLVRAGHSFYFERIVPVLGGLVAHDRPAYRYLPKSAVYLPGEHELVRMLQGAGFARIQKARPMFGAIQAVRAVRM